MKTISVIGYGGIASIKWEPTDWSDNSASSVLELGFEQEVHGVEVVTDTTKSNTGHGVKIYIAGGWEAAGFEDCVKQLAAKLMTKEDTQSITYRAFELAESAIKAAIAQAIEEQFG